MRKAWCKTLCAALAAVMLLALSGAAKADAQQDAATNMELPVNSFADLCAQVPDVPLMDAPLGAEDVAYSVVGYDWPIAQIKFILYERAFCYRAGRFQNSSTMPDISGMKNKFDSQMELGGVLYRQDTKTGAGVASWYYESTHSQYSIAIQRNFDAEYLRDTVVAMRSQSGEPIVPVYVTTGSEVIGTVTAVTATQLMLKGVNGRKYIFSIDGSTLFPDVSELRKNDIVRVIYSAPYATNRLAHRISLVEPVKTPSETKTVSRATKTGTILSRGAERLQILRPSGSIYTFYTGDAAIYGDTWAGAGDSATVSYYVSSSGSKIATKITYRACYDPHPVPNPCPDSWWPPVPEPWPLYTGAAAPVCDPGVPPVFPPDPGPLLGG